MNTLFLLPCNSLEYGGRKKARKVAIENLDIILQLSSGRKLHKTVSAELPFDCTDFPIYIKSGVGSRQSGGKYKHTTNYVF